MRTLGRSTRRNEREPISIGGTAHYFFDGSHHSSEVVILNVSVNGAGILIACPLRKGQMVKLRFPMPREFRLFDFGASRYEIWGVVRFVGGMQTDEIVGDRYEIGLAFTDKYPPPQYLDDPATLFELKPAPKRDGLWSVRKAPLVADPF